MLYNSKVDYALFYQNPDLSKVKVKPARSQIQDQVVLH